MSDPKRRRGPYKAAESGCSLEATPKTTKWRCSKTSKVNDYVNTNRPKSKIELLNESSGLAAVPVAVDQNVIDFVEQSIDVEMDVHGDLADVLKTDGETDGVGIFADVGRHAATDRTTPTPPLAPEPERSAVDVDSADICGTYIEDHLYDYFDDERNEPNNSPESSDACNFENFDATAYFDDEVNEKDHYRCIEDTPIYLNSRLTIATSMLLIATFVMRHGLSGDALTDLLNLVELHCLGENLCRSTMSMYRRYFCTKNSSMQCHYYCGSCTNYIGLVRAEKCNLCSKDDIKYFITFPIEEQIKSLLTRQNIFGALQNCTLLRRKSKHGHIDDVYDGDLYRHHFDTDGFYRGTSNESKSKEIHISLQLNTDGVSLFHSSKFSLWPVYGIINELPPTMRFKRENRLFVGLWFGNQKPNINLYFKPMVDELKHLYTDGFNVPVLEKKCRVIVLSTVADAPARCLLLNCNQFNGYFGCPCCLLPGTAVKVSDSGNSHVYPYEVQHGHGNLRTEEDTIKTAKKVDADYLKSRKDKPTPENGIKGSTILSTLPGFNIIKGNTVDYMHCVFLGVTKMFIGLWINSQHRNSPWSVRKSIKVLNERLLSIQLPNFISRTARSFDDLSNWKASELRSFLIFTSLPVLFGILPEAYYNHWRFLSEAIVILSSTSISRKKLKNADVLIKMFCFQVGDLYGERYYTFNVHSLLHLVQKVENLGPLWAHSCFYFEDFNGELRRLFHGSQYVQLQVILAVSIQQQIPDLVQKLQPGSKAFHLYQSLTKSTKKSGGVQIGPSHYALGYMHECEIGDRIDLVETFLENYKIDSIKVFHRILVDHDVIHCKEYNRVSRRNSYTVMYDDNKLGQVHCYFECRQDTKLSYIAIIRRLYILPAEDHPLKSVDYISIVSHADDYEVIYVSSIKKLCVFVEVNKLCYVMNSPNNFEAD